ncbi:MAG: PEP-CTERM sorting domain-containing protein [Rhodocyclaceae bacterium]|nr:PEP-CTERM sorting domain-containing protein [Rhodocyclaceae bacterium]
MKQLSIPLRAVGFAVAVATAGMANAATRDIGTIAPGTTFSEYASASRVGTFEDAYSFSLLTRGAADVTRTITFTMDDGLHSALSGFNGLTRGLYSAATNAQIMWSSFDAAAQRYFYTNLAPGDYYFKVAGEGWRSSSFIEAPRHNGLVNITAAVPEPESYVMLLAGLGLVGTVIRRRSRGF